MSHLAVQVTNYLETSTRTAKQLEEQAGVKRMTIGSILNNAHPRADRFGQLLRAVDDRTACSWLEAYLLDDCPAEWLSRVQILISGLHHIHTSTLSEPSPTYGTPDPITSAQKAIQRLQTAIARDTELSTWLTQTIRLILGPED